MAKHSKWSDEYWLLLMQVYMKKPTGLKPKYSRQMVALSMELHIQPEELYRRMEQLDKLSSPHAERLWEKYAFNPKKLQRAVSLLRSMYGFNNAEQFYEGVEVNETFEKDFKPLEENENLTPVMLILILDLYFRLTPITMVADTPEVVELARLMKIKAATVEEILELYQHCDPYLNREDMVISPMMLPCQKIWNRYGNGNTESLASFADELKEYFR